MRETLPARGRPPRRRRGRGPERRAGPDRGDEARVSRPAHSEPSRSPAAGPSAAPSGAFARGYTSCGLTRPLASGNNPICPPDVRSAPVPRRLLILLACWTLPLPQGFCACRLAASAPGPAAEARPKPRCRCCPPAPDEAPPRPAAPDDHDAGCPASPGWHAEQSAADCALAPPPTPLPVVSRLVAPVDSRCPAPASPSPLPLVLRC